jgi:hypothetical protein
MVKTIKIAPNLDEIEVGANYVSTEWNGGIRYEAEGLDRYKEDYLKQCFSTAIAMSGRRWQLEAMLNDHLGLKGVVK